MAGDGKAGAVAAGTAGVVLLYSAVSGRGILATVKYVIQGKKPPPIPNKPSAGPTGSPVVGPGIGGPGAAAAQDIQRYVGTSYVWGGAPGTVVGVNAGTDCSGLVNAVFGRDLGQPIPGYAAGEYTGATHGPPTTVWLLWNGVTTIGNQGYMAEPGDICVWQTHMGIAVGNGQYISDQDPALGVGQAPIDGAIPGEVLFIRRYL